MCKFNFSIRVKSKQLPNVCGHTNAERLKNWAKKWEQEKGFPPTSSDLVDELHATLEAYNQTTDPRFVSGECAQ